MTIYGGISNGTNCDLKCVCDLMLTWLFNYASTGEVNLGGVQKERDET